MNDEQIREWMVDKLINLQSKVLAFREQKRVFTIPELANYLRAVAEEAELRKDNPNFPEVKGDVCTSGECAIQSTHPWHEIKKN